uniref:Immunoglobulin V-set domain-containing protein n=1 Tax=Cyprinus carpio TaxID=7962 RepID=A0A8C2EGL5_CYPCA
MACCLLKLKKGFNGKIMRKCKQTCLGTGDGLEPVNGLNSSVDGGWRNTRQNEQTRDLNISNIRRNQTGDYKMEINTSSMILHRKLRINFSVKGGGKTKSVKEGEIIILHTGVNDIVGYDQILWKTEDVIVGEINKKTNIYDIEEERFKGRLQLNEKSGSLTISDSKTKDSGVYHLNMSSSTHTLQRTISVTVREQDMTDRKTLIGIIVFLVLLLVGAIAGFLIYWKWTSKYQI